MVATNFAPHRQDVDRILAAVRTHGSHRRRPALAVLVGLPASGKSRVAEELRAHTGAAVLESDAIRRLLFPHRTYSAEESQRLFAAIHGAIEALLAEGMSVVLDATNLAEVERSPLYEIAERQEARLIFALVTAPAALTRRRLTRREATGLSQSEADVQVYERMRARLEPLQRRHHLVDTSQEIEPVLANIVKEMIGA